MSDEAIINYSSDIIVKVRHNQEVYVELASQGPQGPQGVKGDRGDLTTELADARDAAVAAAAEADHKAEEAGMFATDAISANNAAGAAAIEAAGSAVTALGAKGAAETAKGAAQAAQTASETARAGAEAANTTTQNAKTAAETAKTAAETARGAAEIALSGANTAKSDAIAARDAAQTARDAAIAAAEDIDASRDAAAASALEAKGYADTAAGLDPANIAYLRRATPPAGTSLDTVLTRGVYFFPTAGDNTTAVNFPTSGRTGRLVVDVSNDGTKIFQVFKDDNHANEWQRTSADGGTTWLGWYLNYNAGSLSVPTQATMEAGTNTTPALITAQRVAQAISYQAAAKVHGHAVADITGLQDALNAILVDAALTGAPTAPTAVANDDSFQIATTAFVKRAIDALISGAPGALDTLQELADALGDDPNFAATMTAQLADKAALNHTHTMDQITDLAAALALFATKVSPEFEGTPTAPTKPASDTSTALATTEHVKLAIANSGLSTEGHKHDIEDINDLQDALDAKSNVGHKHVAADITDLAGLLNAKAPKADPTFTGVVTVPTVAVNDNSNVAASTAFVTTALSNGLAGKSDTGHGHVVADISGLQEILNDLATLDSPQLDGIPTAPTADAGTNTNQISTTAFVTAGLALKANALHEHAIADIAGLQTALDAKINRAGDTIDGDLTMRRVRMTNTTAATEATSTHAFQIGNSGDINLAMDNKGVVARNNSVLSPFSVLSSAFNVTGNTAVTGTLSSTGAITSSGDITAASDIRLKDNLERITDALDKVGSLTGYVYDRVDTGARQTGLIAQDVRKVLPEAVSEDAKGSLSLAYGQLAGLLVEAIKELREEVRQIKEAA